MREDLKTIFTIAVMHLLKIFRRKYAQYVTIFFYLFALLIHFDIFHIASSLKVIKKYRATFCNILEGIYL